jgi:hypothetical protein
MREKFDQLRTVGIPGSLILLDDKNRIVEQHGNFAVDGKRRGKDEHGEPWEPTEVARGHKPVDLSILADAIKSQPETDPDAEEGDDEKTTGNSMSDDVRALKARLVELEASLKSAQDGLKSGPRTKDGVGDPKRPYRPPSLRPIGNPDESRNPRSAPGPKTPPSGVVSSGGLAGLVGFLVAMRDYEGQMAATIDRMDRRRRGFRRGLLMRVLFGSQLHAETVHVAYSSDANSTKM